MDTKETLRRFGEHRAAAMSMTEGIAERIDAAIGVLSRRDVSAPTLVRTRETT